VCQVPRGSQSSRDRGRAIARRGDYAEHLRVARQLTERIAATHHAAMGDGPAVSDSGNGLGRNFWKLTLSAAVWSFSDGIRWPVTLWLATTLTTRSSLIAATSVAAQLPQLIFLLPAGVLIDRFDRRWIMILTNLCDLLMVATLGVIVGTGALTIETLLILTFLGSFSEVFTNTTAQVLIKTVSPPERLEQANSMFHAVLLATKDLLGNFIGGILTAIAISSALFISAGGFAVAILCVVAMRGRFRAGADEQKDEQRQAATFKDDLVEGLRWLWRHQILRDTGIVVGISNLAWGGILATAVLFAQDVLGLGATAFGAWLAVLAGGGVIGSFLAVPIERWLGPAAAFLLGLVLIAGAFLAMAVTAEPVLAFVLIALVGGMLAIWDVIWTNLTYVLVPEPLLGRVRSILRISEYGMMPLGALIGGFTIELGNRVSPDNALRLPWFLGTIVFLALALFMMWRVTRKRIEAARQAVEPPEGAQVTASA
jgi:predicted MFS family arabinose efflux permease